MINQARNTYKAYHRRTWQLLEHAPRWHVDPTLLGYDLNECRQEVRCVHGTGMHTCSGRNLLPAFCGYLRKTVNEVKKMASNSMNDAYSCHPRTRERSPFNVVEDVRVDHMIGTDRKSTSLNSSH